MRYLLTFILALFAVSAWSQPPIKRNAFTTNEITFASPAAGQVPRLHGISGGIITWTNGVVDNTSLLQSTNVRTTKTIYPGTDEVTISNIIALTSAEYGIEFFAGTHRITTNSRSWLRVGGPTNFYFNPGAVLDVGINGDNTPRPAIFEDTNGPLSYVIGGYGRFIFRNGAQGLVKMTNGSSSLFMQFHSIDITNGGGTGIAISGGTFDILCRDHVRTIPTGTPYSINDDTARTKGTWVGGTLTGGTAGGPSSLFLGGLTKPGDITLSPTYVGIDRGVAHSGVLTPWTIGGPITYKNVYFDHNTNHLSQLAPFGGQTVFESCSFVCTNNVPGLNDALIIVNNLGDGIGTAKFKACQFTHFATNFEIFEHADVSRNYISLDDCTALSSNMAGGLATASAIINIEGSIAVTNATNTVVFNNGPKTGKVSGVYTNVFSGTNVVIYVSSFHNQVVPVTNDALLIWTNIAAAADRDMTVLLYNNKATNVNLTHITTPTQRIWFLGGQSNTLFAGTFQWVDVAKRGTNLFLDFRGQTASTGVGAGDVSAASNFGTDNVLIRSDGTAKGVQSSGISVDDNNNMWGNVRSTNQFTRTTNLIVQSWSLFGGEVTNSSTAYFLSDVTVSGTVLVNSVVATAGISGATVTSEGTLDASGITHLNSNVYVLSLTATNGVTNYASYQGIGTNNGTIRLNGTNFGWVEFTVPAVGPSNQFRFDVTNATAGQALKIHGVTTLGGTNIYAVTNGTVSATPGGAATQIQYTQDGSTFDGASGFVIPASEGETNVNLTGTLRSFNVLITNSLQGIGTGVNGIDNLVITNWLQVNGPQTNSHQNGIRVQAGGSGTNFYVGGTFYALNQGFTNRIGDAALTNAASLVIPAHMLTNTSDTVEINISGSSQMATATTNQLKVLYGSETLLDSGLLGYSNSAWRCQIFINRTGNSNQLCQATLWGFMPSGATTNFNVGLLQTNGINTTLQVQLASRKPGGITNDFINAKYWPAYR